MHEGKRYSHNLNPHTGLPLTGIKSVSVFSPSAELSDALATAVYVMGYKEGIRFVDGLPITHAIIIDDNNQFHFSKSIDYEEVPA
jgi:thiamine biosynthesis lipoprotein